MRKVTVSFVLLMLIAMGFLSLLYSQTTPDLKGEWAVNGNGYSGKLTVSYENGTYQVFGTAPERYSCEAKREGNTLSFSRSYEESPGFLWNLLRMFGFKKKGKTVTVNHNYTMSSDGKTMTGGWKDSKGNSGKETLSKGIKTPTLLSVAPSEIEVGKKDLVITITGENLPEKTFLKAKDFWFTFDTAAENLNKKDGKIKLKEILEVSDDGTQITAKITVWKTAREGARRLYLKDAAKFARLTITRPVELLPLGQSKKITGEWAKIFVPLEDGMLTLTGGKITELREESKTGKVVEKGDQGYKIPKAGYYFIHIDGFITTLSNTYKLSAETPPEKTPWTFWYFPFFDRSGSGLNLYDDGGVYEKLDKILGVKGKKDGWKNFRPSRHMDSGYKDSRIQKLAKKYYKNGKWTKPDNEDDFKFLKKHNPTTIKGFGWSYQRTEDNNKSWWGHCWGAVVASSLYGEPSAITVKVGGEKITFSQEEVEGVLTSFHTNHSIVPTNYLNRCPSGRPSEKKKEAWDSYIDDFFLGLLEGIGKNGLPLACNLRAEGTDEKRKDEVWNHVVYKYEATLKQKGDDPTLIFVELKVWASDDRHPSADSSRRTEEYTFVLKCKETGGVDRDHKDQNWISASHFTPSYLWRIQKSSTGRGCENEVMDPLFKKLNDNLKFHRIK